MKAIRARAALDDPKAAAGSTLLLDRLEAETRCRPSPPAFYQWSQAKRAGVPWRYRAALAALAAELGVKLPQGFLVR